MMNTKCNEVSDEELIGLNNVGNSTNISQQWLNVRVELVAFKEEYRILSCHEICNKAESSNG